MKERSAAKRIGQLWVLIAFIIGSIAVAGCHTVQPPGPPGLPPPPPLPVP